MALRGGRWGWTCSETQTGWRRMRCVFLRTESNRPSKNQQVLAFRTALWFWMTAQHPKPSCHDVLLGRHARTTQDVAANRQIGLGWTTNIINGGIECNQQRVWQAQQNRIDFYKSYCKKLGVSVGAGMLSCETQRSY